MEVLHARCAGLDVHQATVVACVRRATRKTVRRETREFGTCTRDQLALGDWLRPRCATCPGARATSAMRRGWRTCSRMA